LENRVPFIGERQLVIAYGMSAGLSFLKALSVPRGPKGEKRPADFIGNAVHVMRVLTGEIEETIPDDGKDPAAKALGKKAGTGAG
jgi:hypothetical protein